MTIHTAGRNTVISGVTGLPDINPTVNANPTTSDSCNYSCCFRINVSVGERQEAGSLEDKKTVMFCPKKDKQNSFEENSSEEGHSEKSGEETVKRQAIITEVVAKQSLKSKKKKKNCCF